MGIIEDVRKSVHDLTFDPDETTIPEGGSIDPQEPICRPVLVERARRKLVDVSIDRRLRILGRQVQVTMYGVIAILSFAGLEYLGVIGNSSGPVWARAIFDGISVAVGRK